MSTQNIDLPVNRLLAALPAEDYQRILPQLELVSLTLHQVLYEIDEPIPYVYFPHLTAVSLVYTMEGGSTLEIGLIGQAGVVGVPVVMGGTTKAHRANVQIAGSAMRMKTADLRAEFCRGGALQDLMLRYIQSLLTQVSQTSVANRFYTIEERLARWLLLASDCVQSNEFPLTQEFISQMLGVRRSGVTVAAGALSSAGLIHYTRGSIRIRDRSALEEFAGECYGVVQAEVSDLLGATSP